MKKKGKKMRKAKKRPTKLLMDFQQLFSKLFIIRDFFFWLLFLHKNWATIIMPLKMIFASVFVYICVLFSVQCTFRMKIDRSLYGKFEWKEYYVYILYMLYAYSFYLSHILYSTHDQHRIYYVFFPSEFCHSEIYFFISIIRILIFSTPSF